MVTVKLMLMMYMHAYKCVSSILEQIQKPILWENH